jgi:hypothetical protein
MTFNLLDALRMEGLALQLVPAELVRELVDSTGGPTPPGSGYPPVAALIMRGNMNMTVAGHTGSLPVETGSVWSIVQLAQLYASIELIASGPDTPDEVRALWDEYMPKARELVQGNPVTAQRMTETEHQAAHGHVWPSCSHRPDPNIDYLTPCPDCATAQARRDDCGPGCPHEPHTHDGHRTGMYL